MENKYHFMEEEGYTLIGAAFDVYNEIGFGLSEEIYQQSLAMELSSQGTPFDSKRELKVFYKGQKIEKTYIPDLIVFDEIIVELKSVKELLSEHEAQLFNYMRITKKAVGYLINFGSQNKLEWKRYILKEYVP